jgi:diaminopimelate epimerase
VTLPVAKAHAYGNDFLFVPLDAVHATTDAELSATTVALCDRHRGIGADGLILYELRERAATMRLLNADGSASELSGNGLRCLAALVARTQRLQPGAIVTVDTGAGVKMLDLLAVDRQQYTFRAALGQPAGIRQVQIAAAGETLTASVLTMGNPQCVVLGPLPDMDRFGRLGPALSTHAMFPAGTNVEFAYVEGAGRVRILIWERGVGPTTSSGTGASASAVAAAAHGGASRDVEIVAPGGTQRVEWREDGVYLTGWATIVMEGTWITSAASQVPTTTDRMSGSRPGSAP